MILRQSTSVVISFGPFLDKTDGVTLKTGLATALDHASAGIMISKNGGTMAVRHATVTTTTYDAYGCYKVTLDTTDTGTLGSIRVIYTDATTCLPVWMDYQIVTANEYDSQCAAAIRPANVTQLLGTAWLTPAVAGTPDVNAKLHGGTSQTGRDIGASVISASVTAAVDITQSAADKVWNTTVRTLSSAAYTAIWDSLTSGMTTAGSIGKRISDFLTGDAYVRIGAAGASLTALGDSRIANLDATVSSRLAPGGTLANVTTVATVTNLTNAPTAGDLTAAMKASVTTACTASSPAVTLSVGALQAIWDTLTSSLTTVGSIGKRLVDNITGDAYVRIGANGGGLTALGDPRIANLDAAISTRTKPADTQAAVTTVTNLTNAPTAGDLTATMKASVTTACTASTPTVSATLSPAAMQAIWDTLTSALTTAGSIGKRIVDNLDATVSSRLTPAGTLATVTNLTNAPTAGDLTATMKASVTTACTASTPTVSATISPAAVQAIWDAFTTSLTTVGSIGKRLADFVDATISSRLTPAGTLAAVTTTTNLTNAPTAGDLTATMKASVTTACTASTPTVSATLSPAAMQAIWDTLTSALTTAGSIGKRLADFITGDAFVRIGAAGGGLTSLGDPRIANLDATVSSRLTPAGTLATVTNVTNAPTAGDLTAAMKSSVTTACTASTPSVTVSDKTGYSLAIPPPTAPQIRNEMDNNSVKLANLDATVSSRLAPSGILATVTNLTNAPTSGDLTATMKASVTAACTASTPSVSATITDKTGFSLTPVYDPAKTAAQPSDIPNTAAIADKVLGRRIAGGGDGGRTVASALRVLRNKVVVADDTLTVYRDDDLTEDWTAALATSSAALPITGVDPA